ncbi:MAG: ABC transporter permease [Candidatus Thorarchaeota archaeon]
MKTHEVIIRRLFLLIPVLIGATLITFTLSHVFQDPVYSYVTPARAELIPQAQLEQIRIAHHLNEPLLDQYFFYIAGLLTGDWGISTVAGTSTPVLTAISLKFPATFELTLVAVIIAVLGGIPLGIISAVRKDTKVDHASRILALSGVSVPVFWLGLMLQFFFASNNFLNIFPLNCRLDLCRGWPGPSNLVNTNILGFHLVIPRTGVYFIDSILTFQPLLLLETLYHLILPAFALSWISMALISRMTRTSMLEALKQDYIILARSKGLSERIIIYKHALRNAMIPTVTIIGLTFAGLLTGAVLTESIFTWPGLGQWVTQAVLFSDSASIQGFVILAGLIYVILNLAVDILYTVLDPRISLG